MTGPRMSTLSNPCGLTDRQRDAIEAFWQFGTIKEAAAQLGVDKCSARQLLQGAVTRMGARNRTLAVLQWERIKVKPAEFRGARPANSVFAIGAKP